MAFYKVIFNPLYINNFYPLLGRANFTLFKFFLPAGQKTGPKKPYKSERVPQHIKMLNGVR